MKKLYIPTTTLNFNNILSSESISPESFYNKRDFGYSRWYPIPENDNVNAILLYDSKRYFERPLSDIEDHPLLIEVMVDESKLSKYAEGVYYCDHTIYLDPWHTKFIFFSPNDKAIALSMSESSLETKLIKLYQRKIFVDSPSQKYSAVRFQNINLNNLEIEKDFRINRMKGFLYGYYIGALLSSDKESVNRLSNLKEILNIFAAIASSIEKKPTSYQSERLDVLLKSVLYDLPLYQELLDIQEYNSPIDWINNKINKQELKKKKNFLYPNASEVVVIDNELEKADVVEDSFEQKLYKNWINTILTSNKYNGNINSIREKLSDDITIKAKEIYGEKWDESNTKFILNKLRRHVRGENFDVEWNNGLLSSIAAVITNGSDWTKLLAFMQNHGMYDYRLAFSIYGALNGFANLSRDFTDVLFNLQDRKYVASVYKEIYGQLLGEDPSIGGDNSSNLPDYIMLEPKNEDNNNCVEFGSLSDKVEAIIKANPRRKLSEKDKDVIKNALNKTQDGISFINMIANEMESLTKGIFPCIQKELHPDWKPIKAKRGTNKKKNVPKEQSLFGNLVDGISKMFEPKTDGEVGGKSIIYDVNTENILNECSFLPFDIKKQIIDLFKGFQKSYQDGYYFKNQEQYKRNNTDVIDHFVKWCLSPKNKRAIKWSPENSKLMDELKLYLMNLYAD